MSMIRAFILSSMLILFTACGGGGGSSPTDTTITADIVNTTEEDASSGTPTDNPQTIAIDKIKAYASDGTQPVPTIEDYVNAGVIGVTSDNIDEINDVVQGLTPENVDTKEEIQQIVNDLGINIAPTANAGADKGVELNTEVTITGSGSDIDGTIISYSWTKNGLEIATTASFDYIPTAIGTDILTLTVTDDDGATASDSMKVVVTATPPVNEAPSADAGNDQVVVVSDTVTLNGAGSSDPDNDSLTYSWSFTAKPVGSSASLSSTTTMKPTFTADMAGTYVISLVVNDGTLNSSPDSVTVTATSTPNTGMTFVNNTSLSIPDCLINDCPVVESEINVVGANTFVEKVTISLNLYHTRIYSVDIKLVSPSGTSIVLSDPDLEYALVSDSASRYCDTVFDDEAQVSIMDATSVTDPSSDCYLGIIGTYSPEEELSAFIGEYSNGIWTLQVHNSVWTEVGTLYSWSITIE